MPWVVGHVQRCVADHRFTVRENKAMTWTGGPFSVFSLLNGICDLSHNSFEILCGHRVFKFLRVPDAVNSTHVV